ncbi:MAG: hypothetical protein AAF500_21650 [Myxococcota bacterium]
MRVSKLVVASCMSALVALSACQEDSAGIPEGFEFPDMPEEERFPVITPDPYLPGDERLAVGIFYGGERSETIGLNGSTREYFIFEASYEQKTVDDRLEGGRSDQITLNGTPFWGGGIVWMNPIDLSKWTTMYVAFKSSDPSFEQFDLTLQSGEDEQPATGVALDPTEYGYTNDGQWHFLQIPLQDAVDAGWDPTVTRSPFIIGAAGGNEGDILLIDDLYFARDLDDLELGTGGAGGAGE